MVLRIAPDNVLTRYADVKRGSPDENTLSLDHELTSNCPLKAVSPRPSPESVCQEPLCTKIAGVSEKLVPAFVSLSCDGV